MKKLFRLGMSFLTLCAMTFSTVILGNVVKANADGDPLDDFRSHDTLAQLAFGYSGNGTEEIPYSINENSDSKTEMSLRYGAIIEKSEYYSLVSYANNLGQELTFGFTYSKDGKFDSVNDVTCELEGAFVSERGSSVAVDEEDANYYQFALVFKHIPLNHFKDPIIAKAYAKVGDEFAYMSEKNESVNSLAQKYIEKYDGGEGDTSYSDHIGVLEWLSHKCNFTGGWEASTRIGSTIEGGKTIYKYECQYCGKLVGDPVSFDNYKLIIGTNEHDVTGYLPSTVHTFNRDGLSLSFDPNDHNRFVLKVTGDASKKDIYINSDVEAGIVNTQIYLRGEGDSAKLKNATFKGGFGYLLTDGDDITFDNGKLSSEAKYTTIRNNLNFIGSTEALMDKAIEITNGRLTQEGDSVITINNYVSGIVMNNLITEGGMEQGPHSSIVINHVTNGILSDYAQKEEEFVDRYVSLSGNTTINASKICYGSATTKCLKIQLNSGVHTWTGNGQTGSFGVRASGGKDIRVERNAKLVISNVENGVQSFNAVSTVKVYGRLEITASKYGVSESGVNVGKVDGESVVESGTLIIKTTGEDSKSIKFNTFTLPMNLVAGEALFDGIDLSKKVSAFYVSEGNVNEKVIIKSDCKVGFRNLDHIYLATSNNIFYDDYTNVGDGSNVFYFNCGGDLASYCVNKPEFTKCETEGQFEDHFPTVYGA